MRQVQIRTSKTWENKRAHKQAHTHTHKTKHKHANNTVPQPRVQQPSDKKRATHTVQHSTAHTMKETPALLLVNSNNKMRSAM